MNQEQRIDDLKRDGWMSFQPANHYGWKFFFKRDPEPENGRTNLTAGEHDR